MKQKLRGASILVASAAIACQGDRPTDESPQTSFDETPAEPATLIGAGDIAGCQSTYRDDSTLAILQHPDNSSATVFTLGDNAYPDGSTSDYACYHSSWGQVKDRTKPVLGNHEYKVRTVGAAADANPYFDYFNGTDPSGAPVDSGVAGVRGKGYYTYELGGWRIYVINSEISISEQATWLKADLAANPRQCTLAYWHQPLFTSGTIHSGATKMRPIWDALYAAGAELVLSGHNHQYERFAPQRPDGTADPSGIREFVVGTGGSPSTYTFTAVPQPNSEVRATGVYGVLKLRLTPDDYTWQFIPIGSQTFTDAGTARCDRTAPPPSGSNEPPVSAFTSSCSGVNCTFSDGSTDVDGTIVSRSWNYGDGTPDGTAASHTYAAGGTYNVTLTTTDDDGAAHSVTNPVIVSPGNLAPVARSIISCVNLKCSFNSRSSSDPDGTIVSRFWTFGNGSTSSTDSTTRTYAAAGTYTVTLKVTDNGGLSNTASRALTVPTTANAPPTAAFTSSCTNLSCTFNSSASGDTDGTIVNRRWELGDGTVIPSGPTSQTHNYAAPGTFTVKLTVTDDDGATATKTLSVTAGSPANLPPAARFTWSCAGLSCTFNSSGSSDPDGTIASRKWEFGDGAIVTDPSTSQTHTYAIGGTYSVKLIVTDDDNAPGSVTNPVTVSSQNIAPTARMVISCVALKCSFNSRSSSDPDGTIVSRYWTFGNGSTSSTDSTTRTYATPGTYTVTVKVKDNGGLSNTASRAVTVPTP